MIVNPFLSQLGPSSGGGPVAPPLPDLSFATAAAQNQARALARQQAISALVAGQTSGALARGATTLATQGGKYLATTLSSPAAASLGASTASSSSTSLSSLAGPTLSVAGLGYGAYQSNATARKSLNDLQDAINSGDLDPAQVAAAKQKVFNAGMVNFGVGSLGGAVAGASIAGPFGALAGGLVGGAGGGRQALGVYDNPHDTAVALGNFMRKPWAK